MKIAAADADIWLFPHFIASAQAQRVFEHLRETLNWQQDVISMYGKATAIPRLQAWYGDEHAHYAYSGLRLTINPWHMVLNKLRHSLNQQVSDIVSQKVNFNSVLANFYRDNNDAVGWHSDDEPELGKNPIIASVSLGAQREFKLKHKYTNNKLTIPLTSGSLLIMAGTTQHYWQHAILRSKKPIAGRINLTFRSVF